VRVIRDPDVLRSHLEDAGHFTGGHATELAAPETEAGIAEVLRTARRVLPIGAQSSLTGGATPMGETLLSTGRFTAIQPIDSERVRAGAGVTLAALDGALERWGQYYPPGPTFTGAFVGGTVATNAGGASTFKYGTTREWVDALTVVLPCGDVLDVERGRTHAHVEGYFELQLTRGAVRVPVPRYDMPRVRKLSAGYFAAPEMDLIDLFIGAEGTLGVVTSVTLRVLPARPALCLVLAPFSSQAAGLGLARRLRDAARHEWEHPGSGVDISAIEHMDARSISLIREDGIEAAAGVRLPDDTQVALLITLELPGTVDASRAFDEIGRTGDPDAPDTPLIRLCALLDEAGGLDAAQVAVPGDGARRAQLLAVREAVPLAVNQRIGRAKGRIDPRIEKTAADMIVPFERVEDLLACYDRCFRRLGLDFVAWGHLSDGNIHANVLPGSFGDVESGRRAILECGREVVRLGGAPLAEHGVGRNRVKQQLLRDLYGDRGIEDMRRVKHAIDPEGKMAPGVLF
jgi:D-lactate dehydrogenase (cytochrome)